MIVEENKADDRRWLAFIANGDTLKCGNNDELYGPYTKLQIDSILKINDFVNFNEKVFVK